MRTQNLIETLTYFLSGGSLVPGMRKDVRAEVEPEGASRVVALRQEVPLHVLRQNLHKSELDESAHQEDSPREPSFIIN